MKEGSGDTATLSIGALRGETGRGLLYWGLWRICKGRLWWWASLYIEAHWETLKGIVYQGLQKMNEEGLWKQCTSQWGSLCGLCGVRVCGWCLCGVCVFACGCGVCVCRFVILCVCVCVWCLCVMCLCVFVCVGKLSVGKFLLLFLSTVCVLSKV